MHYYISASLLQTQQQEQQKQRKYKIIFQNSKVYANRI